MEGKKPNQIAPIKKKKQLTNDMVDHIQTIFIFFGTLMLLITAYIIIVYTRNVFSIYHLFIG